MSGSGMNGDPQPPVNSPYVPPHAPRPPMYTLPPRYRRPKHPQAQLRNFTIMDAVAFVAYVGLLVLGLGGLILFVPGVREQFQGNEEAAAFAALLFTYVTLFILVLIAVGRELWQSFKTFRWYPWVKYLCIPGGWLATILINVVIIAVWTAITGEEPSQSANQQSAQGLADAIPWYLMFIAIVLCGPLVEEFFFRHLMIGKLSRWINPWILLPISALLFMGLHFVGGPAPTIDTAAPYVVMGLVFGTAYILTGKSVAYSYILHAFNNGVSLLLMHLIDPSKLPDTTTPEGAAVHGLVRSMGGLIGA